MNYVPQTEEEYNEARGESQRELTQYPPPDLAAYLSRFDAQPESQAFPLNDVLKYLVRGTEILLQKKDYDGPDYEEMNHCVKRAKEIMQGFDAPTREEGKGMEEIVAEAINHFRAALVNNVFGDVSKSVTNLNGNSMNNWINFYASTFQSSSVQVDAPTAEDKACPECEGEGIVIVQIETPVCCGRSNEDGSCCGNSVVGYEPEQEQCGNCKATGKTCPAT